MLRIEKIDPHNLLKKRAYPKPGEPENGGAPDMDKPDADRDLSDSERNGEAAMNEALPKHLPRPTRR